VATISFQCDEHLAHAVATALRRRGVEVWSATEAGMLGLADEAVLAHTRATGRVLVTHDSDFLVLHQRQQEHAGIVYCPQGTRTIGQIVAHLLLIHQVLQPSDMVNQVEFV
jgi:predicted nuclease of predicted toxin-antitoxin system